MSDLELIKQVERRIGKTLVARELDFLIDETGNGYVLNEQQRLIGLNLDECELVDIAFLSQFTKLQSLSLHNNQITEFPALKELNSLTKLDLSANQITKLATLQELKSLTELYLSSNQITELTALKELKSLIILSLFDNKITELTSLKELKNLTRLDLSYNQIRELPAWVLDFDLDITWDSSENGLSVQDNPLESPPPEIIKQGNTAIKAYFDSLKSTIYRAKTFVF